MKGRNHSRVQPLQGQEKKTGALRWGGSQRLHALGARGRVGITTPRLLPRQLLSMRCQDPAHPDSAPLQASTSANPLLSHSTSASSLLAGSLPPPFFQNPAQKSLSKLTSKPWPLPFPNQHPLGHRLLLYMQLHGVVSLTNSSDVETILGQNQIKCSWPAVIPILGVCGCLEAESQSCHPTPWKISQARKRPESRIRGTASTELLVPHSKQKNGHWKHQVQGPFTFPFSRMQSSLTSSMGGVCYQDHDPC